jgi:hypothetical protein
VSSDDIDRIFSCEDSIIASSGFATSVMEAVRREAEMPPPIPFPWRRALPGLIICVVGAAVLLGMGLSATGGRLEATDRVYRVIEFAKDAGFGWIVLAIAVSLVSVALSMSVGGNRATGE